MFIVISGHSLLGDVLSLRRSAVGVFYSPTKSAVHYIKDCYDKLCKIKKYSNNLF